MSNDQQILRWYFKLHIFVQINLIPKLFQVQCSAVFKYFLCLAAQIKLFSVHVCLFDRITWTKTTIRPGRNMPQRREILVWLDPDWAEILKANVLEVEENQWMLWKRTSSFVHLWWQHDALKVVASIDIVAYKAYKANPSNLIPVLIALPIHRIPWILKMM